MWPRPLGAGWRPSGAKEQPAPGPPSDSFFLYFILSLSLSVQAGCVSAGTEFSHVIRGVPSHQRRGLPQVLPGFY